VINLAFIHRKKINSTENCSTIFKLQTKMHVIACKYSLLLLSNVCKYNNNNNINGNYILKEKASFHPFPVFN